MILFIVIYFFYFFKEYVIRAFGGVTRLVEFYKTYNPDVGYNTAFVLGIMLGTLLLYVIYRTKIRKPLIAFLKRKFKEIRRCGMPPEVPSFPDIEVRDNCEPNDNEAGDTAECPDDVFFEEVEFSFYK
jgi:hypothetical protein